MTYPSAPAKNKHDLQCTRPLPGNSESLRSSELRFSSSAELFGALEKEPGNIPSTICSVYSYPDGPDFPGPLSRSLLVIGVADISLSLVRKIVANEEVPDCMHKCTLAVQLADQRHIGKLEPRHKKNSSAFAAFMKRLRSEEVVAILGKDKHERFGILVPMGESTDSDEIVVEDCAVHCYVGDVREVMEFLSAGAITAPTETENSSSNVLWQPDAGADPNSSTSGLWKPPGANDPEDNAGSSFAAPWDTTQSDQAAPWETNNSGSGEEPWTTDFDSGSGNKRPFDTMENGDAEQTGTGDNVFHADSGAAAADAFYSGLTRSLDTRADSHLFHMRAFNGWVKATQIQELDPRIILNGKVQPKKPIRVLDLACGKGGDLTKWTLHERGLSAYVGIDVARGSLRDAAIRAREMRKRKKLNKAVFTCADLGEDVPGRKRSPSSKHMQKLLTWSLEEEPEHESATPDFKMKRGGGVSETDRFDVVSVQFAIHYMMSTLKRARRFFHTVSELLEIGGNLICTTIDARVVLDHMMNLGLNYHFEDESPPEFDEAVVQAGAGACKIKFEANMVKNMLSSQSDATAAEDDLFGLEYSFTLVEGSDHAAGVGDAVNLPEWLTPIPVLDMLGREAGLELDYAQNFHEFFETRKDPSAYPSAHHALYNMKVLNRNGSISKEEWSVSRLYAAMKFRKVRESSVKFEDEAEAQDSSEDEVENESAVKIDPIKAKKMLPMAMMKAKRAAGGNWESLSSDEKKRLTQVELEKLTAP